MCLAVKPVGEFANRPSLTFGGLVEQLFGGIAKLFAILGRYRTIDCTPKRLRFRCVLIAGLSAARSHLLPRVTF